MPLLARRAFHSFPIALALALVVALLAGCDDSDGFDDRGLDAATDAGRFVPGPDVPLPGRICTRNAECNDAIECTEDVCGSDGRCQNLPNSARCDDGVYCNGEERCDPLRGCARGTPVSCSDNRVCTADRCIEATRSCERTPLDRDGDGDPDDHCSAVECGNIGVPEPGPGVQTPCWRGHDCNDTDPRISSMTPEVCGDGLDNDCDGQKDETGCRAPSHDTCTDPLDVSAGGFFALDLAASAPNYRLTCAGTTAHDIVARFTLSAPRNVTLEASSEGALVGLALQSVCGGTGASETLDCAIGLPSQLRRLSLPAGQYFVVVATTGASQAGALSVRFDAPTPPAPNETCANAISIPLAGAVLRGDLAGAADEVSTPCGGIARDLVYTFTTTTPRDASFQLAGPRNGYVFLSLASNCARMPDVARCDAGDTVQFTAHQLPPGTYYVVVESFAPAAFTLQATFDAPTPPPAGDTCGQAIAIQPGVNRRVNALGLQNDYALSCARSGRDAVLRFDLGSPRDIQLDVDGLAGATVTAALATQCGQRSTERACTTGLASSHLTALGLDPGSYYVTVKSERVLDFDVLLQTYAPLAVTSVTGNDNCTSARVVPPGRAYFRGDTSALANDVASSPCAGATPGKDAVFAFTLGSRQQVTAVTDSVFSHVAWITRVEDACPGTPVGMPALACGFGVRTTLNTVLDPGTYRVIIDGQSPSSQGSYGLLLNFRAAPASTDGGL